jgi:hypothetical protein
MDVGFFGTWDIVWDWTWFHWGGCVHCCKNNAGQMRSKRQGRVLGRAGWGMKKGIFLGTILGWGMAHSALGRNWKKLE